MVGKVSVALFRLDLDLLLFSTRLEMSEELYNLKKTTSTNVSLVFYYLQNLFACDELICLSDLG